MLTLVDVLVSCEDLTWPLTFVHVPISGKDSLNHQSTLVLEREVLQLAFGRHPPSQTTFLLRLP